MITSFKTSGHNHSRTPAVGGLFPAFWLFIFCLQGTPAHATTPAPIVSETGLCLDAKKSQMRKKGSRVRALPCKGSKNQTWRWGAVKKEIKIGDNNGLCLDAQRSKATKNGAKVMLWSCHGGKNQKWRFKQGRLVNGMGLCLDISKASLKESGNRSGRVQVWKCHKDPNQRWGRDRKVGLLQMFEPSRTNCGAANQRVCKKHEQLRGCDPGFHRTQPVGGICTRDNKFVPDGLENGGLKEKAQRLADMTGAVQQVLKEVASCITPQRSAFKDALDRRDRNAASQFAFKCVSPQALSTLRSATKTEDGTIVFRSLSIAVGASSMYGAGLAGETGIVLALDASETPRIYTAGGMKFGVGAGVSADVIAGVSTDAVAAGKSNGFGVGAGGKYLGGAGVGVFFDNVNPFGKHPFNGVSVSGGGGISFEIGVVSPTWSQVY